MARTLLVLALLGLFLLAASAELPSAVRQGIFPGRTGDFVLAPRTIPATDGFLVSLDGANELASKQIDDTAVAALAAHIMGVPLAGGEQQCEAAAGSSAERSGFPATSLFRKPRATVLVTVVGMGSETLEPVAESLLPHTLGAARKRVRVVSSSYPADELATLTTLATGSAPAEHGIVQSSWLSWNGERIEAYADGDVRAQPLRASLADAVVEAQQGASLVLAVAADRAAAAALGVHQAVASAHPYWNHYTLALDEADAFDAVHASTPELKRAFLRTSRAELLAALAAFTGGVLHRGSRLLLQNTEFDLNNAGVFAFFAELQYVRGTLLPRLADDEHLRLLVADGAPDLFSLGLTGLASLQQVYAAGTPQHAVAMQEFDRFLAEVQQQMQALYGNVAFQVLFTGTVPPFPDLELYDTLYDYLAPEQAKSHDAFWEALPQVYLRDSSSRYDVQFALEDELDSDWVAHHIDYAVDASHAQLFTMLALEADGVEASDNKTNGTSRHRSHYTDEDVASYQTCMWTSIFIIIVGLLCIWRIYHMEFDVSTEIALMLLARRVEQHH